MEEIKKYFYDFTFMHFDGEDRICRLCVACTISEDADENSVMTYGLGVSVKNPKDSDNSEIATKIASGRAVKQMNECLESYDLTNTIEADFNIFKSNKVMLAVIGSIADRAISACMKDLDIIIPGYEAQKLKYIKKLEKEALIARLSPAEKSALELFNQSDLLKKLV